MTVRCDECGGEVRSYGPLPEHVCTLCDKEFSSSRYGAMKLNQEGDR